MFTENRQVAGQQKASDKRGVRVADFPSELAREGRARSTGLPLEALLEWPEFDLLRPGRTMLTVDLPIGLGDSLDVEEPVFSLLLKHLRPSLSETFPVYAPVDNRMRDM